MSEREELRALAVELHDEWCLQGEDGPEPDWRAAESCHGFAGSVMDSDWLAAHDDRIRAEALDQAADVADGFASGVREDTGIWLRDRAAALRAAAGTPTRDTTEEES